MSTSSAARRVCPRCGASIAGIYSSVPGQQRRWYKSSTVRGCPSCGAKLAYDSSSKRWLLLNLCLIAPVLWRGDPPGMLLYGCVAIALLGDTMFLLRRRIVAL
jgi:hypothetical protein